MSRATTTTGVVVRSGPGFTPDGKTGRYRKLLVLAEGTSVDVEEVDPDDARWVYVRAGDTLHPPVVVGWVAREFLRESAGPGRLHPPFPVPSGQFEIRAMFGEFAQGVCFKGRAHLPAPLALSWSPNEHVTWFQCHEHLAAHFTVVFQAIYDAGLWSTLRSFGGCYANRAKRLGSKVSTHAWGIAVDLNPATNAQGTAGDMDPRVVEIFEAAGFTWGGRWVGKSRDPMHFQFASGY